MQKIYTALDRAKELGFTSTKDFISAMAARNGRTWNGQIESDPSKTLMAHINAGRWCVHCECGTGAYADPDYPVTFCAVCGNAAVGFIARTILFPPLDERKEIESELLQREITSPFDIGTQTIMLPVTKPVFEGMQRAWIPGQTIQELKDEHENAKALKGEGIPIGDNTPLIPAPLRNKKAGK